jgi:hypothetical protein
MPHEEHMHGEESHCGHHHVHGVVDPSLRMPDCGNA